MTLVDQVDRDGGIHGGIYEDYGPCDNGELLRLGTEGVGIALCQAFRRVMAAPRCNENTEDMDTRS